MTRKAWRLAKKTLREKGSLLFLPLRRIFRRRIPTAFITGTKGKTTTSHMLAHILGEAGFVVGLKSTDGVAIGGEQISEGSRGYLDAVRVLRDPSITAAVLELGRGGLLRRGLYIDGSDVRCDVAALLNVGWEQIGIDGVNTLEQMVKVKRKVVDSARNTVVLNADDRKVSTLISEFPVHRTTIFSFKPGCRSVKHHLKQGGVAYCLEERREPRIVRLQGQEVRTIIPIADLPSAWGGIIRHNIANAMAAAALADGLGITSQTIQAGLRSFAIERLPGRFNIINHHPILVIVDRAWTPPAAEGLAKCLTSVNVTGRRICMLTAVGDRPEWHYGKLAAALAKSFDQFICYELEKYRRGRMRGEINDLLRSALLQCGVEGNSVDTASDYESGLTALSARAQQGDLVIVLGAFKSKEISMLRTAFS